MATKKAKKNKAEEIEEKVVETGKEIKKEGKKKGMELWQKMVLVGSITLAMIQTVRMWQGIVKRLSRGR